MADSVSGHDVPCRARSEKKGANNEDAGGLPIKFSTVHNLTLPAGETLSLDAAGCRGV
jgi:hypothetical protein